MSLKKISCSWFLVVTMILSLLLPFSLFPDIAFAKVSSGSDLAGIKGYSYELATMVTSRWTTVLVDLKDGNLLVLAKPLELVGSGKSISFELTYNSVNHDLDVGLGYGWTSNLFESVEEDPLTHDIIYTSGTGARLIFTWNGTTSSYNSPKGFEGTLTKQPGGTYQLTDWNYITTTFDATGKLSKFSRLTLDLVTIQYDLNGFPVSITDAISNRSITVTWSQGNISEVKDAMNQTWKLNYSINKKNLLSMEKPDQSKTEFTYDTDDYLLTQKDFKGQTYTISYVSSGIHTGKISTITLPSTGVYEFSYNNAVSGFSSETQVKDPENFITSYFFGTTSFHLEKITSKDGTSEIKTTYQYDTDGFIAGFGDSYNQATTYTRDIYHRIIQVSYPPATTGGDQFQIEFVLDPISHLKVQKKEKINPTPVWAITSYEYTDQDCPVKPSKQTDPLGTETTYDYNSNHHIESVTTGTGSFMGNNTKTQTYTYSVAGNPNSYTDGEGNESIYTFNANGFLVSQLQFEGSSQNGQVVSNLSYEYDSTNQLEQVINNSANITATKSWDDNGALTSSTSFGGCSSSSSRGPAYLIYPNPGASKGSPGNCLSPNEQDSNQIKVASLGIIPPDLTAYNPKQIQMTDSTSHTTTYEYFSNGTMKKETDYMNRISVVTLDPLGRIGKITDWSDLDITFSYDLNNRMIGKNEEGVGAFNYTYYLNGRVKSVSDPQRGTAFYSYNLLGNLLADEKGFYSYDLKGNRLTANYYSGSSDTWTYSREGYLLTKNGTTYTTDKLGNAEQINTEYGDASITYISSLGLKSQITGTNDLGSYSISYNVNKQQDTFTDTLKNDLYRYAWNQNATLAELKYPNQTVQTYTYQGKHPDALQVKLGTDTLYASQTDFDTNNLVTSFANEWKANQITHSETLLATYDSLHRTSELTYSSDNQTIQYGYLPATGTLASVAVSGMGTYQISNTLSGKLSQIQYPNNGGTENYSYFDNFGRVTSIQYPNNRSLSFTWNGKNQITQIFGADMGNIFSYNVTYDGLGKMKSYTKSENGMQTESWLFSYGLFGLEKASRNRYGIQDIAIDYTTDFSGRVVSMTYQQIEGHQGELYFHYDNYGNTAILTNPEGVVIVGYLYKLHNGKITDTYNPSNIVNPLTFHSRAGYFTLNAFNDDLKIQISSIGSVNLTGGAIGWIDLRAPYGGPIVAGGTQIDVTVNDSISPCLEECEKKGMVKCCKEYRSKGECERNCNEPGSGNGMNEHGPEDEFDECVKKCGNICKEWGCCNTGSSPSLQ